MCKLTFTTVVKVLSVFAWLDLNWVLLMKATLTQPI